MSLLGASPVPKCLVLAAAKAGKTTTIAKTATATFGKGYVACCSTLEHLRGAKDECEKAGLETPEFDMVKSIDDMEAAIKSARTGVKEGAYKWVLVDDFGLFATVALDAIASAHRGDGRKYWDAYTRHVNNVVLRFLDLKVPVFFSMHFIESGPEMEGQVAKSGPGIVPALQGGNLRQTLPGQFNQVIWMERVVGGARIFRLSVAGVTGPGSNNLPDDVTEINADVGQLMLALTGKPVDPVSGKTNAKGTKK